MAETSWEKFHFTTSNSLLSMLNKDKHKQNAHNVGNKAWSLKTAFRNSVPHHKEVHWIHHRCYMSKHSVQCH